MASYSRPTRIVSGKEVSAEWQVDAARFKQDEERALWEAFQHVVSTLDKTSGGGSVQVSAVR